MVNADIEELHLHAHADIQIRDCEASIVKSLTDIGH
jgi:hypothetical protein